MCLVMNNWEASNFAEKNSRIPECALRYVFYKKGVLIEGYIRSFCIFLSTAIGIGKLNGLYEPFFKRICF